MLTWSYEANPACNVLVGENPEVTAAKSTVPETNKSSSSRPKTSTASTTSSTNSQSSSAGASGGKDPSSYLHKQRYRRSLLFRDSNIAATAPLIQTAASAGTPGFNGLSLHEISLTKFDRYMSSNPSLVVANHPLPRQSSTTSSPVESNGIRADFRNYNDDNDGRMDEGESSGNGYDNGGPISLDAGIPLPSSLIKTNPHSSSTGDGLLNASTGLDSFVNVFDVTHVTNRNEDLTASNYNNGNEAFDLITDSFDESSGFDINNNNLSVDDGNGTGPLLQNGKSDVSSMSDPELADMVQNDSPTIIAYGQPSVEIVRLDDEAHKASSTNGQTLSKLQSISAPNDEVQIHTLPTHKTKPMISNDIENDIDKYSYVESSYPERTYYQMHDANSNPINTHDLTSQRILVNVSIATDTGAGTQNHGVYMLHVSVPAGPDFLPPFINTPVVHVKDSQSVATHENIFKDDVGESRPPDLPPQPPCPCQCIDGYPSTSTASADNRTFSTDNDGVVQTTENQTQTSPKAILIDETSEATETTEARKPPANDASPVPDVSRSCLESQDIPTILILEGERKYRVLSAF